ncbi:hypothetical protein D9758_014063 [Tetrapyrgos nigripes]|uniref:Uncharacterized protein n=1 Tax=Tetrapyrgos nigripes TaxID=182062 RepID=A0A8H5CIE9_9AGAR|nr:hypothetical protein D9758_014063 [Tetrapyrgos nigripes]
MHIPAAVAVGVPAEATCKAPQTQADLNLTLLPCQGKPEQENDIFSCAAKFLNIPGLDSSIEAEEFIADSTESYAIQVRQDVSDSTKAQVIENSIAFAAVLASTPSTFNLRHRHSRSRSRSSALPTSVPVISEFPRPTAPLSSSPSTPSTITSASNSASNDGTVPELSGSTSPNDNNTTSSSNSSKTKASIAGGVVGGIALCASIVLGFWVWRGRQEKRLIKVQDPFNVQDSSSTDALRGPQKEHWTTNAKGRQFISVSTTQRQDLCRERDAPQAEMQQINSEIRSQDGSGNDSGQLHDMEARMREIQARVDMLTSEMAQVNRLMAPPSYVSDEGSEAQSNGTTGMEISGSDQPRNIFKLTDR